MLRVDIDKHIGDIDLALKIEHERGVLVLFGRSGGGKTTTLRTIVGIDRPDRGEISFDGRLLYSSDQSINVTVADRSIGFIFQHHNLFPHMTAIENIAYAARDRSDIKRWLEMFRVAEVVDHYPDQLSGGEQQRVAIIRALVTKPKMLLMDEPLSAVDIATRNTLLDELRSFQQSTDLPIIYVTHNVSEAFRFGDRVIVLERGKMIHDGVPIDVFHAPTSVPVASLSGTENILNAEVVAHHDDDDTTDLSVGGTILHVPLCRQRVGETVVVAVRPEDILISLNEVHQTSARNQLRGTIAAVLQDRPPSILIQLSEKLTLRARVTHLSLETLGLRQGEKVYVLIKAWAFHPVELESASHAADAQDTTNR